MIDNQSRLSHLTNLAYEAAIDQSLWQSFATGLAKELGGVGGTFIVLDSDKPVPRALEMVGRVGDIQDEYSQSWVQYDPQVGQACGLSASRVYTDRDYALDSRDETRAYTAWERGHGFHHHASAVSLLGDGRLRGCLSVHSRDVDYANSAEIRKLARIFPDVSRAMQLGFQFNEMLVESFWNGVAARNGDEAILLLDETGRILRATEAALLHLGSGDGLSTLHERLCCASPSEETRLFAAIMQALSIGAPRASATRVSRRSGRSAYAVIAYPIARHGRMLAAAEAAAMVRIIDRSSRRPQPFIILMQIFGLTRREAEFAAHLAMDHSVESAAATLRIAMPTARTHLRQIFQKTSTSGQSELIKLISLLS